MEGGNSDGHEPWNNAIRRIEIIFRGCWSVVELLTAKRKKNKTEKRKTVSWEGGGERKKKKKQKRKWKLNRSTALFSGQTFNIWMVEFYPGVVVVLFSSIPKSLRDSPRKFIDGNLRHLERNKRVKDGRKCSLDDRF